MYLNIFAILFSKYEKCLQLSLVPTMEKVKLALKEHREAELPKLI